MNTNPFEQNNPIPQEPAPQVPQPVPTEPTNQPASQPAVPQPQPQLQTQPQPQLQTQPQPQLQTQPQPTSAYPPVWQPFTPAPVPATVPPKTKNKGLRILCIILAVVVVFVAGVSGGFLSGKAVYQPTEDKPQGEEELLPPSGQEAPGETSDFDISMGENSDAVYSYEQIVEKVSPSIVNITVYSPDGKNGAYASGVIMDAQKGYVLTNDHIYSEIPGAKFLITLNNKTELKATFVSGDSRSDIAILKIENPKNLVAANFSTAPVKVGERVLAIGQSYGYADTVSEGIVSAASRRVNLSGGGYSEQYIQTTAAINPGNSGGALVNLAGQVVGITSAKIASQEVEGLGFAIPSQKALSIVKNLQANGTVKGRAKLGITYTQLNTISAEANQCPLGIYVQSVEASADIAKQGIVKGDIITHVNGKEISVSTVLLDIIETAQAGDKIKITVYKANSQKSKTVTVTLMEAESGSSYQTEAANDSTTSSPFFPFGE